MSTSNGVIRIGRKGRKKFAIGEEDDPRQIPIFEVDVVVAFQEWIGIDSEFRSRTEDQSINHSDMCDYHRAAVDFVKSLIQVPVSRTEPIDITTAEALDFIARLREQYDEVADFFRPKSREKHDSQDSSEAELRFLVEEN